MVALPTKPTIRPEWGSLPSRSPAQTLQMDAAAAFSVSHYIH
jgi:hypothetical protein